MKRERKTPAREKAKSVVLVKKEKKRTKADSSKMPMEKKVM